MSKGIQNNRIRTVDVIYTKLGREYKASGDSEKSKIVKFSLSDDGVDYNLYDSTDGGKRILNTPQFSAWTDGNSLMRNTIKRKSRSSELKEMTLTRNPTVWHINDTKTAKSRIQKYLSLSYNFDARSGFEITMSNTEYLVPELLDPTSFSEDKIYIDGDTKLGNKGSITGNIGVDPNSRNTNISIIYHGGVSMWDYGAYGASHQHETVLTVRSLDNGIKASTILRITNDN